MKYLILDNFFNADNSQHNLAAGSLVTENELNAAAHSLWTSAKKPHPDSEVTLKLIGMEDNTLYRFKTFRRKLKVGAVLEPVLDPTVSIEQAGTLTSMQDLIFRLIATLPQSELVKYMDHTLFKIERSHAMVLLKARMEGVL